MANQRDYERSKISDPELRSFAASDSDERLSVLIELEVGPPELVIGDRDWDRDWGQPSLRALAIGKRDDTAIAQRMAALHKMLVAILDDEPVRLDMAEAFVADVTPAQLREITRLADVGQIRPNRRHRVG